MTDLSLDTNYLLPLRDVVFQTLRSAILTGELKPGERLMEIHLSKRLGVSRTPVRDALRMLEAEGLVTNVPRKGAVVAEISEKGLKDVLEVRRALDSFCAFLACERISDEEKEHLKEALSDFREAVASKDNERIAHSDVAFHDIIIKATGNDRMVAIINNLAEQMYRYRYEYIKDVTQHERLISEHERLMNAILEGNAHEASEASREHIDHQEQSILNQLHKQSGQGS